MRHKTVGYIVTQGGMTQSVGTSESGDVVVYIGQPAGLFPTRSAARAAIARTARYRNSSGVGPSGAGSLWFPAHFTIERVASFTPKDSPHA